jgi:hypothetical protein
MARTRKADDREGGGLALAPSTPGPGVAEAKALAASIGQLSEEHRFAVLLGFFEQLELAG